MIINDITNILKEDDFSKREKALLNQKNLLLSKIKEEKDNAKYILLLLTIDLELRWENEYIMDEQKKLIEEYSDAWTERDFSLWKINYAGFLFEEEKEEEQALRILEELDTNSSEYAEKYSILGQIYYNNEEFKKAEECFKKAVDLCEKTRSPHKYREYNLAYVKCKYMDGKYEDVIYTTNININELNWEDEIDIELVSVLVMAYLKLKCEEKAQILLAKMEEYKAQIVNTKYDKYIEDVIYCDMEPEGISICPYSYCPRHMG